MAAEYFHGGGHELAAGGKIFWPEDIPCKDAAAGYLEEIAARFLRNETTN
jgi:phosphoesterase RecJ-like protein